jgi:hypothetical protein
LGEDGVDSNDAGDADSGNNEHQNYPVLTTATDSPSVSGTLDSTPKQTYTLDFYGNASCHTSGYGEGEVYLGSTVVTTDDSGYADFTAALSGAVSPMDSVTATATDADGNTSEFSACVVVAPTTNPTETPTPTSTPRATPTGGRNTTLYLPIVSDSRPPLPYTTGSLEDASTLSGLDNVTIGAVQGTLTTTLTVTIGYTTAPTQTLPGGSQHHGHFYSLSADRFIFKHGADSLILGLPVPTGVSTDTLGIALYKEGEATAAADWSLLVGRYDTAHNLMLATLPYIDVESITAVLISHPALSSPINNPPDTNTVTRSQTDDAAQFELLCLLSDPSQQTSCESNKAVVESELQAFYGQMKSQNYAQPFLQTQAEYYSIATPTIGQSNTYVVSVNPNHKLCKSATILPFGTYITGPPPELILCQLPSNPLSDTDKQVLRHEFFHALQAGYVPTFCDLIAVKIGHLDCSADGELWILEGTAAVAENSDATNLKRTLRYDTGPFNVHYVDRPLKSTENDDEYRAQDFWIYHLQKMGQTLEALVSLFGEQGVTTEAVINWLGGVEELKETYWRWVRNQVMVEDNINFDGILGTHCALQTSAVKTIGQYKPAISAQYLATLSPLTSHVVQLKFDEVGDGNRVIILVDKSGFVPDPDLRYKVYEEGEACLANTDGDNIGGWTIESYDTSKEYYILISNVDPEQSKDYIISFD